MKEGWFIEALQDNDLDLILVFGHVDIRSSEYALLHKTIRSAQWDLPIQFFGGHSHIRVCPTTSFFFSNLAISRCVN